MSRSVFWRISLMFSIVVFSVLVITPAHSDSLLEAVWFSSPGASNCTLQNMSPSVETVGLVLLYATPGAQSVRFRVEQDPELAIEYLSEQSYISNVAGNTQDGLSVCFDECVTGTTLLVTMQYMTYGSTGWCRQLRVVSHPDAETVEVTRCDGMAEQAHVRGLSVLNIEGHCACEFATPVRLPGNPAAFGCSLTSTESRTWGAVKSLYEN